MLSKNIYGVQTGASMGDAASLLAKAHQKSKDGRNILTRCKIIEVKGVDWCGQISWLIAKSWQPAMKSSSLKD